MSSLVSLLFLANFSWAQTSINLREFRDVALRALTKTSCMPIVESGIWFQDHVGPIWTDFSTPAECVVPSSDYATVSFLSAVEDLGPYKNLHLAYVAGLNGEDNVRLVTVTDEVISFYTSHSLLAIIAEKTPLPDVEKLITEIQARYPGVKADYLNAVGVLTIENLGSLEAIRLAYRDLQDSAIVTEISLDAINYIQPFELDRRKLLGDGKEATDVVIDPETKRSVSAPYRKANYLRTAPSLPPPFGVGPVLRTVGKCEPE